MGTPRHFVSIKFSLISVAILLKLVLCLLMTTTEANPNMGSLRPTGPTFCTCGTTTVQQKYCNSDFVILGKVFRRSQRRFNWALSPNSPDPYWGTYYNTKVLISLKGPAKRRQHVQIYFIGGLACGINVQEQFEVNQRHGRKFVIFGFLHGEKYVVTQCGWIQKISRITEAQAVGLFLKKYKQFCNSRHCNITASTSQTNNLSICSFHPYLEDCYSRYAICTQTEQRCHFTYNNVWPAHQRYRRVFRKILRKSRNTWKSGNYEDYFTACTTPKLDLIAAYNRRRVLH